MDIEGYAKRGLSNNVPDLEDKLTARILEVKKTNPEHARKLAQATITEAKATLVLKGDVLEPTVSGVTMGEFGVGSRGLGDFYTHEKIAEVIGKTKAVVDTTHLDDSGVVKSEGGEYVILTVDGMHSRLSDYSFLAGFHVARAALRDVYVMGARPVAMLSDIHVADDGDVGKVFDHIAGITAVADLSNIPLITGSTLRIGGDMVIGERMTGGVGAVGVSTDLTSREQTQVGDVILMTEGAGGGTISTTALYYEMHEIVDETINIKFLEACEKLLDSDLVKHIHAMTDVTNGGIRGDAKEISRTACVKLIFEEKEMRKLVNPKVLDMLESLEIDYLGVSLDALLIIAPEEYAEDIMKTIRSADVDISVIGKVVEGTGAEVIIDGEARDFTPRFRESAYTPIKKMIGDENPRDFDEMKKAIDTAALNAIEKKRRVVEMVKRK
ncbi:MAG: hydrogenase expression/formation protein [Methanolobus sp.]|uniref:AIR synthase-related protein n=1 Tax=Methanolobus sp. TaxID=1874737 RepID=UPI0024ABD4D2|nr:AIR synthase-related protein [Methanolobus sp.]MDI3485811.1 hydrogenase expression/formation protein [Methanolobus sp.]MDK2831170.1 hydrogenase expression/formation protein [Methanolobus sp.]MDK2937941.1 hydrogenase expression/formation protein [Methanolobus sp.]